MCIIAFISQPIKTNNNNNKYLIISDRISFYFSILFTISKYIKSIDSQIFNIKVNNLGNKFTFWYNNIKNKLKYSSKHRFSLFKDSNQLSDSYF